MIRTLSILLAAIAAAPFAMAVQSAPAAAEAPLAPAAARQVAETLASALERLFVFPEVGRRYAATLRAHAAAGDYDALGTRTALAEALTRDVQAVQAEGHFRVFPAPGAQGPAGGGAAAAARPEIEEARMLAPGIAYLRPTIFSGSPDELGRIEHFLEEAEAGGARTLIIDMRVHRGGGLDEMDAINRRIFAEPARLLVMDTRAAASAQLPFQEGPTLRRADAPAEIVRREHWAVPRAGGSPLQQARVFLLVSGYTVSAGEHFALALQRTHRAMLIGAGTQGAGNFGTLAPLGEGLAAFIGIGRTYDPDTGQGWEGAGINPDVEVPAPRALVEALIRSGVAPEEAERLSASVAPTGSMELRPGRPVPHPRPRRPQA
ncbi:MAG: S41 family peptidase [Sphingomonadaceae bacterium]|nr:S41 family peptidase [Sphingomonadaceae bacterium]